MKIKERERRKIREKEGIEESTLKQSLLEKIEEGRFKFETFIKNIYKVGKISEEDFKEFFSTYPLILTYLDSELLILIVKSAEELKIEFPENIKYDIGYCLADLQTEIATEEEKNQLKKLEKN